MNIKHDRLLHNEGWTSHVDAINTITYIHEYVCVREWVCGSDPAVYLLFCRFIPYCSSDVWSGTGPTATKEKRGPGKEKEKDASRSSHHQQILIIFLNTKAISIWWFVLLIAYLCFPPVEYTFMGSLIIREVIKDLVPKGIKQAKVVMLAGTRWVPLLCFGTVPNLAPLSGTVCLRYPSPHTHTHWQSESILGRPVTVVYHEDVYELRCPVLAVECGTMT